MNIEWLGKIDGDLGNAANFSPPRVPGSSDALAVAALTTSSITDLNAILSTECDEIDGWTVVGTITADGEWHCSNGSYCIRDITIPTTDYIVYIKAKTAQIAGSHCDFRVGPPGSEVRIKFDHNGSTTEVGAVCGTAQGVNILLETGVDTSSYSEWVIQIDQKQSRVYFYRRTGTSTFEYMASLPYASLTTGATQVRFNIGGLAGQQFTVDYFSVCKPNVIAIGDSNCKRMGLDITNYSAWGNINILKSNRNCLVVNKGVGSDTSAMVLARLAEDVIAHGARACLFQCTQNDYSYPISLTNKFDNTQDAVDLLVAADIDVVLLTCLVGSQAGGGSTFYMAFNADYYPLVTGATVYCDWLSSVADSETGLVDAAYIEADHVHLNAAGHVVAGAFIETDCDAILEGGLSQNWPDNGMCGAVMTVGVGGSVEYGANFTNRITLDGSNWLSARTQNTIGCDFIRGAA